MKPELESSYGRHLLFLVNHLIKNAKKIPDPVLQAAREFEAFTWSGQDLEAKRGRMRNVAELTEAPSEINRHIESYPHAFSKAKYAEYLAALKLYKADLGI